MDTQTENILQSGPFGKLLDKQITRLRQKYDMKRAELEILYYLSRCGENNTPTDIHNQLMMNRGHISQAVDSLCRRKFIAVIPDEKDRRYVHYELLDAARDVLEEMTRSREETYRKILAGISEEELRVFREVSLKIRKNMERLI